jgi:PAS domain S-box-containing protein
MILLAYLFFVIVGFAIVILAFALLAKYAEIILLKLGLIKHFEKVGNETIDGKMELIRKKFNESTQVIATDVNSVHTKQFKSTMLLTFTAIKKLFSVKLLSDIKTFELVSCFPNDSPKHVDNENVHMLVKELLEKKILTENQVFQVVETHERLVSQMQKESVERNFRTPNIYEKIGNLSISNDIFNKDSILHEDAICDIFRSEGLEIYYQTGLKTLASIVRYQDSRENTQKYAVFVKDDQNVHPSHRTFAIAHELGHWLLHIKDNEVLKNNSRLEAYLHSLNSYGPFEDEADTVAVIALFPTLVLCEFEALGKLTPKHLLNEFTKNMDAIANSSLEKNWTAYLEKRIEIYKRHLREKEKHMIKGFSLDYLRERDVKMVSKLLEQDYNWAIQDSDYNIISVNDNFVKFSGFSKEEFADKKTSVLDLIDESAKEQMKQQLDQKRIDGTSKFYTTKYKYKKGFVSIYSVPILKDPENMDPENKENYLGSFAIAEESRKVLAEY